MVQAEAPADPRATLVERMETLTRVLTSKVPIAQTPKELVWTLNKAKLYRYIPVVAEQQRHRVPLLLVSALMNWPYIPGPRRGKSFVPPLIGKGFDVYLLAWGSPGVEDKHLKFDDYT